MMKDRMLNVSPLLALPASLRDFFLILLGALNGAQCDITDLEIECAGCCTKKTLGRVGEGDIQATESFRRSGKACAVQEGFNGKGTVLSGIHQCYFRSGCSSDGVTEEGVMGATENEGINAARKEWG
jgi:hypothetical protein